jgi:hypothetical protein
MAREQITRDEGVPPPSEQVHLPPPSLLPAIVALGITVALVGLLFNPVLCALGLLVTVIAIARWITDVRRDIAELPLEH